MKAWKRFIAKSSHYVNPPTYHPLWAHIIDVYCVAETLLRDSASQAFADELFALFGYDRAKSVKFLSFIAALHDIGKAFPRFQFWVTGNHQEQLKELGLKNNEASYNIFTRNKRIIHPHSFATGCIIQNWAKSLLPNNSLLSFLERVSYYLSLHHGEIYYNSYFTEAAESTFSNPMGDEKWRGMQVSMIDDLAEILSIFFPVSLNKIPSDDLLIQYAGFITLADWVGSMEEYFPFIGNKIEIEDYLEKSRAGAEKALAATGLKNTSSVKNLDFKSYFPLLPSKRRLQEVIDELAIDYRNSLTIIEAPTGEGKTEAALYLAGMQQSAKMNGGIYVAMPTQATSNGLFGRFEKFIGCCHDSAKGDANIRLIHGNSLLYQMMENVKDNFHLDTTTDEKEEDERKFTADWFQPKKRSLLAPYGVGTVDQVFLSVLNVKHFFLRLYALGGKTIIFDEVHAYDTYMLNLFERLLQWLKVVGANVIILSATLPQKKSKQLLKIWNNDLQIGEQRHYPAILHVTSDCVQDIAFEADENNNKKVILKLIDNNLELIAGKAVYAASNGANVAVLLNTVLRTQEFYNLIVEKLKLMNASLDIRLFHSRYLMKDRDEIEQKVLSKYGKKDGEVRSGTGSICVATQVIEQSLDLDFDYMITDLAPIDLLIQRSGRLHRHKKQRPAEFSSPTLEIIIPDLDAEGIPKFKDNCIIYDEIFVYRTWYLLCKEKEWNFPDDYRMLIEGVYYIVPDPDSMEQDLSADIIEREGRFIKKYFEEAFREYNEALNRLIPTPDRIHKIFQESNIELAEDENSDIHKSLKALTRLGDETISCIAVFKKNGKVYFDQDCTNEFDYSNGISFKDQIRLLENSIKIPAWYSKPIIEYQSEGWKNLMMKYSLIKHFYLLKFEDNICQLDSYILNYNKTKGLIINKKED